MENEIISAAKARDLLKITKKRKEDLIKQLNDLIKEQSAQGLRYAHILSAGTEYELDWLCDSCVLVGYKTDKLSRKISW